MNMRLVGFALAALLLSPVPSIAENTLRTGMEVPHGGLDQVVYKCRTLESVQEIVQAHKNGGSEAAWTAWATLERDGVCEKRLVGYTIRNILDSTQVSPELILTILYVESYRAGSFYIIMRDSAKRDKAS